MTEATEAVINDVLVSRYTYPYCFLRDRIKTGKCFHQKLGSKATFRNEQQREIASHCLHPANLFFELTNRRRVVFEHAELNNIKTTFNKTQRLEGRDWLNVFLKKNLTLSIRKFEETRLNRIIEIFQTLCKRFYVI
jgi:hypothetical protein